MNIFSSSFSWVDGVVRGAPTVPDITPNSILGVILAELRHPCSARPPACKSYAHPTELSPASSFKFTDLISERQARFPSPNGIFLVTNLDSI